MQTIAIVGAGNGGRAILSALRALNTVKVVGVADLNAQAPGMLLARELGIPVTTDVDTLISRSDLDVIIEATGRSEVVSRIQQLKAQGTELIQSQAAQLMMELADSQGQLSQTLAKRVAATEGVARQAAEVSQRIAAAMGTLQATSGELAASGQFLAAAASQTEESLGEVEQVLGFLRQVANKTRMIGLNAAIEAARVGEQGKGFAVVASEVRKLAQTSNESAENISHSLQQTLDSVKQILDGVVDSHRVAESQATATTEISAALQELATLIQEVGAAAKG